MIIYTRKEDIGKIIVGTLLLLFPILDQYAGIVDKISLGETLLIIAVVPVLLNNEIVLQKQSVNYLLFLFVSLGLSVFSYMSNPQVNIKGIVLLFIRMAVYAVFIIILGKYAFDSTKVFKIYGWICVALCVYLILQYIMYYSFDKILPTYVGFLNVKNSLLEYSNRDMEYVYSVAFRPSALFSEPAKMAQFLIPYLAAILIYCKDVKKRVLQIVVVTTGIILSTSFMGAILTGIIYVIYFIKEKISLKKVIAVGVSIVALLMIWFKTNLIAGNISRMAAGLTQSEGTSSAGLRLIRGWEIFWKIPIFNKIFGVGLNSIGEFLSNNHIQIIYGGEYTYSEYTSTFTYILITCGVVGMFFFIKFIMSMYLTSFDYGRKMIMLLIVMSMGSSFLVTPTWVVFILLIYYHKEILPITSGGEMREH